MGRQIVVHYRGCEIRDSALNQRLHPGMNICQECEYSPRPCATRVNRRRRQLAARYGSAFLVTTPDMRDFVPAAVHVPFFVTRADARAERSTRLDGAFRIVHATNHPGIEGTRHIRKAIEEAQRRGHRIEYVELTGVPHDHVLRELATADLSIGKMKMGYYANLQIESMAAGVPTITYVRPEFVTDDLRASGFILATLETLADVLDHYLSHPELLAEKRRIARDSILTLHDNARIAEEYKALYARVTQHGMADVR
jgi:hypothetical protein